METVTDIPQDVPDLLGYDGEPQDELELMMRLGSKLPTPTEDSIDNSIIAMAGGDEAVELELVNQHLLVIAHVQRRAETPLRLARWMLDRVQRYIERVEGERDRIIAWYENRLDDWRRMKPEPGKRKRSYEVPAGTVGLRRTPQKLSYNDPAIIALANRYQSLYEQGIVELKPTVNHRKFRERFEITGTQIIDRHTGVLLEPVSYMGPDGEKLSGPIATEIEPAADRLSYKITGAMAGLERDDDDE